MRVVLEEEHFFCIGFLLGKVFFSIALLSCVLTGVLAPPYYLGLWFLLMRALLTALSYTRCCRTFVAAGNGYLFSPFLGVHKFYCWVVGELRESILL